MTEKKGGDYVLDFEDNNFKLLRMKEAELLRTDKNREENLLVYERLAKNIDNIRFDSLIGKIEKFNEDSHSLEDELVFLTDIKDMYEQLEFMQYKFRSIYQKYSLNELILSDLNTINKNVIDERIDVINGYLINLKIIDKNKRELESLSEQLIDEEKKKKNVETRILEYEDELRVNFVNAEGRLLSLDDIKYTSVLQEFRDNGFDLNKIIDDTALLDDTLKKCIFDRKENEEKLSTALLCYDSNPNRESRDIKDSIEIETIRTRYRLSLIKMAKLVSEYRKDYEGAKRKREELIDLIKYRNSCLEKLGVRFSIDPFSRIKVSSQLDAIIELGSNSKAISNLRKMIDNINSKLEDTMDKNTEFLMVINNKQELLNNKLSLADIDVSSIDDDIDEEEIEIADNQVVEVKLLPGKFMIDRVREKTTGVINRVYEMINVQDTLSLVDEKKVDVIPELVIEDVPVLVDTISLELPKVEQDVDLGIKDDVVLEEDSIFTDVIPFESVELFSDRTDDVENEDKILEELDITEDDVSLEKNDSQVLSRVTSDNVIDNLISRIPDEISFEEEESNVNENLTQEIEDEIEMPDAFWETKEEEEIMDEKLISLDEQINSLLSEDDVKTRKLVA